MIKSGVGISYIANTCQVKSWLALFFTKNYLTAMSKM